MGRSWAFHAKLQMRLLLFTVWDLYHRMWKDIRAGVLPAKGHRFLLFAYNACNACFGPGNTHANFDTKKAWLSAWLSSSCASSQWFLDNLQELAHDRGILVPVGVERFFESLKECPSLSAIGAQPRMMSWFSLNTSIRFVLPGFTLNQQGFLSYHRRSLEEPAAVIDGAAAKALRNCDVSRRGAIASLWQRNCSRRGVAME